MSISVTSLSGRNPWYPYGSGDSGYYPGDSGNAFDKAGKKAGTWPGAAGPTPHGVGSEDRTGSKSLAQNKEIRDQLRLLKQEKRQEKADPFGLTQESMLSSLVGETETEDKEDVREKMSVNYNFRSVTSKIQQAKTSASAGQAVLSAKRKIQELKRKLANSDADPDEITFALNHAKRIERVARKKKRHLEMEEQVTRTQQRDERLDKTAQAAEDLAMSQRDLLEEELTDKQKEFDELQTAMFTEAVEKMKETRTEISDDMIASVDAMIDAMTEEEQEMLFGMTEMLENMEILDPHMSEEELAKLKTKHRNAENKEIVKADADYWKAMMKHQREAALADRKTGVPGFAGFHALSPSAVGGISGTPSAIGGMTGTPVAIGNMSGTPSAADIVMSSFEVQA